MRSSMFSLMVSKLADKFDSSVLRPFGVDEAGCILSSKRPTINITTPVLYG
jgi:hypothetical protein